MDTFDLKKFLTENKLTALSRQSNLQEQAEMPYQELYRNPNPIKGYGAEHEETLQVDTGYGTEELADGTLIFDLSTLFGQEAGYGYEMEAEIDVVIFYTPNDYEEETNAWSGGLESFEIKSISGRPNQELARAFSMEEIQPIMKQYVIDNLEHIENELYPVMEERAEELAKDYEEGMRERGFIDPYGNRRY